MTIRKLAIADAVFERSPGQDGEVFAGNMIDQRHGGPITIGYGRYGPEQVLNETMTVDDVMVVLEGQLTISTDTSTVTAGPGEIVYMPKGEADHTLARAGRRHGLCHIPSLAGGARVSGLQGHWRA